jgi:membrane-associated phospholipid phosphatase
VTPPGHWNLIATQLAQDAGLPAAATARMYALLNTAQADAFIAAWDTKFAYSSIRPVTAIRRAIDPDWKPLIATPPFPSYVSGHATTSGAASTVLAALFPDRADDLRAMAREAAISRLYGGIHFPTDNSAGLALGEAVGRAALAARG